MDLTCKHKVSYKKIIVLKFLFYALQVFNDHETWRSYKTTINLNNVTFFKKKIYQVVSKLFAYFFKVVLNVFKTADKSTSIHTTQIVRRTALKDITVSALFPTSNYATSLGRGNRIFLNENLRAYRRSVVKKANGMRKNGLLVSVWTIDGKINFC